MQLRGGNGEQGYLFMTRRPSSDLSEEEELTARTFLSTP